MIDDDALPAAAAVLPDDGEESEQSEGVDAANPQTVRRQAEKAKQKTDEAADFWRAALSTPIGRRELWGLLTDAGAFEDRFGCGPNGFPQPEASWFSMGQRSLGLRLYRSWLIIDHDAVNRMHVENDPQFAPQPKPKRKRQNDD